MRSTIPKIPKRARAKSPSQRCFTLSRKISVRRHRQNIIRLYPGNEVRLRYAYFIKCTHVVKDEAGEIVEVHATYDPSTRGGDAPDGRKVKSTIHWVSAAHAKEAEIRMYDRLFTKEDPEEGEEGFLACLNPDSLQILNGYVEPLLAQTQAGDRFQFERQGYFCTDQDSTAEKPVFNLTVSLKDTWAKIEKSNKAK